MAQQDKDRLLAVVRAATAERNRTAGDPAEEWGASATASAIEAFVKIEQLMGRGDSSLAAPSLLGPLGELVRASAAEVRMQIEFDPGVPGLERRFWIVYIELGGLAAMFAGQQNKEYRAICESIAALSAVAFRESVTIIWNLLHQPGPGRYLPPRSPRALPFDNREYYTLRRK